MDIHRSSIKDFILPKVKSVILIDYYEGIQGLLTTRQDFPFTEFFANPRTRTQTEIIWASDSFTSRPVLLHDLQGTLKERYAYALKTRIEAILHLIESLKEEPGGEALAEMLSKSISYIDEQSVYCGEGNVVVVNWGIIPRRPDPEGGSIFRSGHFVSSWSSAYASAPVALVAEPTSTVPDSGSLIPEPEDRQKPTDGQVGFTSSSEDVADSDTSSTNGYTQPLSSTSESQPTAISLESNDLNQPISVNKTENAGSVTTLPKTGINDSQEKIDPVPQDIPSIHEVKKEVSVEPTSTVSNSHQKGKKDMGWSDFISNLCHGCLFLLKKLWWLLLAILIIILCLYLFRDYQGITSQVNPFYNPLPAKSVILPVESCDIEASKDGIGYIASDRLNILLEKKSEDTMFEWAKAFKGKYPSEDIWIYYYNEELYQLQIKVPKDRRETIQKELKSQLKDFSFDVFEEPVFINESMPFDDADLSNPMRSWYLDAVHAYDAWEETLGSEKVVVAVIDNGFDLNHPELMGKVVKPYNAISQDTNVRPIVSDEGLDAHGTHVASTAVGNYNNGEGLMGIAPKCKLMPIQAGYDNPKGAMLSQAIIEGFLYAIDNGADVINASIGMYVSKEEKSMSVAEQLNYINNSYKTEEVLYNKIFQKAREKNCIIVFAAGNENMVSGVDPKKRCDATFRVSAVDLSLQKAYFSNFGNFPELNRYYSTVSAPGMLIWNAVPNGEYRDLQGTSMAAPIVTGAVALLRSIDPSLSAVQTIEILQETGRELGESIGPLIDLGKAVQHTLSQAPVNCSEVGQEIERLRAKLDSLISLCPDAGNPRDTLKYHDVINDPTTMDGLWKTTTSLVASMDNSPIELYMKFKNLKGTLIIKNHGNDFTAPLSAEVKDGVITIVQHECAVCEGQETSFSIYSYECTADRKGNLQCIATNEEDNHKIEFNLVKVK